LSSVADSKNENAPSEQNPEDTPPQGKASHATGQEGGSSKGAASAGSPRAGARSGRDKDRKIDATSLSFERPILEMEAKVQELKSLAASTKLNLNGEVVALEERLRKVTSEIYAKLTPWEMRQGRAAPRPPADRRLHRADAPTTSSSSTATASTATTPRS
jgi:hypothetical protein